VYYAPVQPPTYQEPAYEPIARKPSYPKYQGSPIQAPKMPSIEAPRMPAYEPNAYQRDPREDYQNQIPTS